MGYILLVEDNQDNANMIIHILKSERITRCGTLSAVCLPPRMRAVIVRI